VNFATRPLTATSSRNDHVFHVNAERDSRPNGANLMLQHENLWKICVVLVFWTIYVSLLKQENNQVSFLLCFGRDKRYLWACYSSARGSGIVLLLSVQPPDVTIWQLPSTRLYNRFFFTGSLCFRNDNIEAMQTWEGTVNDAINSSLTTPAAWKGHIIFRSSA
jgi:hypothetical protein